MILLSLDASTKSTGYAIFKNNELIQQDCIVCSSSNLYQRINKITQEIIQIIKNYNVDTIVMEDVIPEQSKSHSTFRALIYLQATIHLSVYNENPKIKIDLFYPGEWRKQCNIKTGKGIKREQLKSASIDFVKNKYSLNLTSDDIADAICIGTAYLKLKDNDDINWQ